MLLLVIADPAAPFIKALSKLPTGLRTVISEDPLELKKTASMADAVLYAHTDAGLLMQVLPLAPHLRWIHCLWTGVENILQPALINHPAPLTNGRGVFRWPLADWVTGVMLFFAFDFRRVIRQQEEGVWKPFVGASLHGRTIGIVGFGSIGSAVAERAHSFGMKVAALRRRAESMPHDALVDRSYAPAQIRQLMSDSDYIVVATPLTPETRGLIGEAEISAMKPTGVLINIGRGPVVVEEALVRALESHAIRGAALDVFDTEPLPVDHPFWRMSNVLLSPHTADRIEGFLEPAFSCFFENLERFEKSFPLLNVVDKQAGY